MLFGVCLFARYTISVERKKTVITDEAVRCVGETVQRNLRKTIYRLSQYIGIISEKNYIKFAEAIQNYSLHDIVLSNTGWQLRILSGRYFL
jgi:hypothetical protein